MRRWAVVALVGIASGIAAAQPSAALRFDDLNGHLAIGFTHLFSSDTTATPGGSISIGGGVDVPLGGRLRAGVDVGYHLLGSRTLAQGSLTSGLDYSVFEALALLHWSPLDRGPELIVSGGPGLFAARASLAATSVGATFSSLAIEETRAGAALALAVTRRRPSPVRVGFELGLRVVPLESTTWTLTSARIVMRY
ncbi:MAG: hypothetical protein ACRENJ_08740 [Candidatus Eiseniibacteriota bacterium]